MWWHRFVHAHFCVGVVPKLRSWWYGSSIKQCSNCHMPFPPDVASDSSYIKVIIGSSLARSTLHIKKYWNNGWNEKTINCQYEQWQQQQHGCVTWSHKAIYNATTSHYCVPWWNMEHAFRYMHASLFSFYYTNDSFDQLTQMYFAFTTILSNPTLYKKVMIRIATSRLQNTF